MSDEPREILTFEEAEAQLLSPGSPFELATEEVLGERMQVYKTRAPSLRALVERSEAFADAEYMVWDDGRRFTYAEHRRLVASVARALQERFGIQKGDRVAILAANCPEWILTWWALASLGAVTVAMNGWWAGDEIEYGKNLTDPKLLIADRRRLERLEGRDPGVSTLVIEDDFAPLLEHDPGAPLPDVPLVEDDPVLILFTSGTTGRPKGAVLSHRCLIAFAMTTMFLGARSMLSEPNRGGQPGANLAVFPLFHVSGLFGSTVTTLATGGKNVWTTGRFEPEKVIRLSQQEGITSWSGATAQMFRLLDHPEVESFDLSVLQRIGVGGSATTPELIRRTEELVPHLAGSMSSGYGSTETGALVSYANGAMLKAAADSVGPPLPTVEVKIVDEHGDEVPPGVDGRICARSPLLMIGYWNNPIANAETLLPGRWLDTGDFGRLVNGHLHMASRKRDLILRGGENVYPIEIENRLEEHPDVAEVAVHGVDHRELGQEVKAVVVPSGGATLDPDELKSFVAAKLAYFKVPAYIEVRTEPLPRNATGKVMKHVLTGDGENTFVEE